MGIDLNCDLGESFGVYKLGQDEAVIPYISSANVACGFHAGDPRVMRRTVALCREHGVAVGAHPSVPDRVGFGRRTLAMTPAEARDDLLYQLGALEAMCRAEGVTLQHVKPHGALYHMALTSQDVAAAVAQAVKSFDPRLVIYAMPGTALERAAAAAGLGVAREGFGDRAYSPDGSLVPRRAEGSLITDPARVAERVRRMVVEGRVAAFTGEDVDLRVDTICLHGDNPGAAATVQQVQSALVAAGITISRIRAQGG